MDEVVVIGFVSSWIDEKRESRGLRNSNITIMT